MRRRQESGAKRGLPQLPGATHWADASFGWYPRLRRLTFGFFIAWPQASAFRTSGSVPADPSFSFFVAMNFAYSSTKILPGGRKSNSLG